MGYGREADAVGATLKKDLVSQWWPLVVSFTAGLGFRIVGFRWISQPLRDPLSMMLLTSVLGLLSFSLLVDLGGDERYGIYFLQCMLSIFAFSRLRSGCWRGIERSQLVAEWLKLAGRGVLFLAVGGFVAAIINYATHGVSGIHSFRSRFLACAILLLLLTAVALVMKRSRRLAVIGSALLMGVFLLGFLAWVTPWLNFSMGRMRMDITLTPGEVRGLHRLKEISAPGERFATNKHTVEGMASRRERSYAYGTLAERPVILEGFLYVGESTVSGFETLLYDNDLLFTTTKPDRLRDLAKTYHVKWLVARPGTDIALPRPLPAWLEAEKGCGDLKIYRIQQPLLDPRL